MEAKINKIVSLNDMNYHIQRNKMKDILFVMKLQLPVFTRNKPQDKLDEEWAFEHEEVWGFILRIVKDNVYNHIYNNIYAQTLWHKLHELYA